MSELSKKEPFKFGDCIRVKEGVMDVDMVDKCLAGRQGRIYSCNESNEEPGRFLVDFVWDSITLRDMPEEEIQEADREGLIWWQYSLFADEVELVEPRDSEADTEAVIREIDDKLEHHYVKEFNIYTDIDGSDEQVFDDYSERLVTSFVSSQEGRELTKKIANLNIGHWVYHFIDYAFTYASGITELDSYGAREVLEDAFPRKISIYPQDANKIIPELIAFWQFLKREYELPNAEGILKYLRRIEPNYNDIMNDESKFGMAKSFVMAGMKAGYDMNSKENIDKFMLEYNSVQRQQPLSPSLPLSLPGSSFESSSSETTKKQTQIRKKKRKQAKASKKANRKKKK